MRFLCTTFGSSGDVFPILGLAIELRRRGHEVTIATNAHFSETIQRHGIAFEPIGDEEQYQACIRNPDLWHPRRAFPFMFRTFQSTLTRQYELFERYARHGDWVGIANCLSFGALMAQDKLGIPVITLHLQPSVLWSDRAPPTLAGVVGPRWWKRIAFRLGERLVIDPVVCPFLNRWRAELGLPAVRQIVRWWNSRYSILCAFPDWYAPRQSDWPNQVVQTDFPLWNDGSQQPLDRALGEFLERGDAPIVFTPGTANCQAAAFFQSAVDACQRLDRRGVLLTPFDEQVPAQLPPSVMRCDYVPLDRMLMHASAFVHHGGIGSVSQGMLAGIPQVVMPLAHDQFDNADRLRRLGIGDSIPPRRFTAKRLTACLGKLLQSSQTETACQGVAQRLASQDGLRKSVDAIEARVGRKV